MPHVGHGTEVIAKIGHGRRKTEKRTITPAKDARVTAALLKGTIK